jgi:hypothetical protein
MLLITSRGLWMEFKIKILSKLRTYWISYLRNGAFIGVIQTAIKNIQKR